MKTKRRYFGRERAYCILKYRAKKHSSVTSQFWNIFFWKCHFSGKIEKIASFIAIKREHSAGWREVSKTKKMQICYEIHVRYICFLSSSFGDKATYTKTFFPFKWSLIRSLESQVIVSFQEVCMCHANTR